MDRGGKDRFQVGFQRAKTGRQQDPRGDTAMCQRFGIRLGTRPPVGPPVGDQPSVGLQNMRARAGTQRLVAEAGKGDQRSEGLCDVV